MIRAAGTPVARAARTNSWIFSDITWPRTMRAIVSHETAPSATNSRNSWPIGDRPPKNASSTMTTIM